MEIYGEGYMGHRELLATVATTDEATAYVCGVDENGDRREWSEAWAPVLVIDGVDYGYDDRVPGMDYTSPAPAAPGGVWFVV